MLRGFMADAIDRVKDDVRPFKELIEPHRRLLQATVVVDQGCAPLFTELADPLPRAWAAANVSEAHTGDLQIRLGITIIGA